MVDDLGDGGCLLVIVAELYHRLLLQGDLVVVPGLVVRLQGGSETVRPWFSIIVQAQPEQVQQSCLACRSRCHVHLT